EVVCAVSSWPLSTAAASDQIGLVDLLEQRARWDVQCACQPGGRSDPGLTPAALDLRHVRHMDLSVVGQSLLTEAAFLSEPPEICREGIELVGHWLEYLAYQTTVLETLVFVRVKAGRPGHAQRDFRRAGY